MAEYHHFQLGKLTSLSARLEELFSLCGADVLSPELTDEVAATAGEIMLLLADHGGDELVRAALEDARRLREAARTPRPEPTRLAAAGAILTADVASIIREERRAA